MRCYTAVAMLSYREHAPSPRVARFVKCFWTLRGCEDAPARERILPDGRFELVCHLGDAFVSGGTHQPRAMVIGEIRRPTIVETPRRINVFGVRLRIGGARSLFKMPMIELRDSILPLEDVIRINLDSADSTRHRIEIIECLIEDDASPVVQHAIALIRGSRGNARIRDVASAVGTTDRTLQRLFDEHVGMTPKMFSRLTRFRAYIESPELDAGYFDDSHRIRDFHQFSGTTPGELARERNAMNDAFVGNVQDGASDLR
jgi:AraC-like DNA-binding protein